MMDLHLLSRNLAPLRRGFFFARTAASQPIARKADGYEPTCEAAMAAFAKE
jgi:hypothetical protein